MIHKLKDYLSWKIIIIISIIFLLWLVPSFSASADSTSPPNDENCKNCHENLYQLYDSGKWYCLCSVKAHCTFCHNGNNEATTAEEAHVGLAASPISENIEACQSCHPQDYSSKIEHFTLIAGVKPTPTPCPNAPHSANMIFPIDEQTRSPLLVCNPLKPWQIIALSAIVLAFMAVLVNVFRLPKENRSG